MISGGWVCALHVRTAGLGGAALGSDEEETVYLAYVVIDVQTNQVIGEQEYAVRPTRRPSEESKTGQPLDVVVQQFDTFVRSLEVDPLSPLFRLVTNGQTPLRQCLHPEACGKELRLPAYYARFHDLRKEFVRAYTLRAVTPRAQPAPPPPDHPACLQDMLNYLGIAPYAAEENSYTAEVKDMVNIIQSIIADGYRLELPESVDLVLETGICGKDDEIDGNCIVRARGPWRSDQDVARFFRGLNIAKGGVVFCSTGEALVRFVSQEHRDLALKRHKHHTGPQEIEWVADGATSESVDNLSHGVEQMVLNRSLETRTSQASTPSTATAPAERLLPVALVPQHVITSGTTKDCVRLRGLPYEAQVEHILIFLGEFAENIVTQGVHIVYNAQGHPSGEVFIQMNSENSAFLCAQQKHHQYMTFGKKQRYIEVFQCPGNDMNLLLSGATRDSKIYSFDEDQSNAESKAGPSSSPYKKNCKITKQM